MSSTTDMRIIELLAQKAELDVSELDLDRTLEENGLDSLHLSEVALWVRREYRVEVDTDAILPSHTLREAHDYLLGRIR